MARKSESTADLLTEQRRQMIAEAAYYRAECRGFCGGDPEADWLEAEAAIDALLLQQNDTPESPPERDTLLRRFEARLHEWDQKIDELAATAKDSRTRLSNELHAQITTLTEQRDVARQKLAALREHSADTWHDIREQTIHFFDQVHAAFDRIALRLKEASKSDNQNKKSDVA
jgi:DNA anti-recombination protein RmuC